MEPTKEQIEKDKTTPEIFYDSFTGIKEVIAVLDGVHLEATEREELIVIVKGIFDYGILSMILSHLPEEHHQPFLIRFDKAPGDPELLSFLKKTARGDIVELIKTEAEKIREKILKDIEDCRQK